MGGLVMDSVKCSSVNPSKTRLGRTFARVLHIKSLSGKSPDDSTEKKKSHEKKKKNKADIPNSLSFDDQEDEQHDQAVEEVFLAKLFANISALKAAYAQLQFFQSPYDAYGIQSADQIVVSELKNLSELKQSYLKHQLNETSPETTLLLSEIQEHKSLLKIYEITSKKLDSQLKLKDSEVTFLKEKLAEANKECKSIEKQLNSSGLLTVPENIELLSLRPSHFIAYHRLAVKSVRVFVRLLISEMESADWDLDVAASSIEPGISFWKPNHKCYVFESYVCKLMFDGFDNQNFSTKSEFLTEGERRRLFLDMFMELKSIRPSDYLAWKPKSKFATFCRDKFFKLVPPEMEMSFFGNLDIRNLVTSGEFPETPFFVTFSEMAKHVWLLHRLVLAFDPVVSIFQVSKGTRFSEVYMESLSDEAFLEGDAAQESDPSVAFTVVPGFRVDKTFVQCQVYLY